MSDGKLNFIEERKTDSKKIICLGKTFNNDEERREYFRDELRKKLPELKKIEGYPIGEDEDIIELSDPPYYTACPNPWLNDFIEEWEKEKEKIPGRKKNFKVDEPYASDVSEGKDNSIYRAHSYVTKVPHPAIMRFILHYTQPGDIILDGFAGTGMTGVAAQMCGSPDPETKGKIENDFGNKGYPKPLWGIRHSINNDLSTLASYIAYNFNIPLLSIDQIKERFNEIISKITNECKWLYETKHNDGIGNIIYSIWSDVFRCPNCSEEINFWDDAIDFNQYELKEEFNCKNCNQIVNKDNLEKCWENYFDSISSEVLQRLKSTPVLIKYNFKNKFFSKKPDADDIELLNKIDSQSISNYFPINKVPLGHNLTQPIKSHGIKYIYHFFTKRNLIVLSKLYSELDSRTKILFTALLLRSTRMVATILSNFFAEMKGKPIGGWAGKPREGTLYIPSITTEVSILESLKTRTNSIIGLFEEIQKFKHGHSIISTSSLTSLSLPPNSVDYIFTDPPFGANRMYSDLNYIVEAWLKIFTNTKEEAIENKYQDKTIHHYIELIQRSFNNYYRVLKPNKWMTVEFSNTSAAVWNGIQTALQRAGFVIANVASLDKKQGSIKAVTTPTAVKQDLIISCYKPSEEFEKQILSDNNKLGVWEFIREHLEHLPIQIKNVDKRTAVVERSPQILYDRLITFYVMRGLPVPIDAGDFQLGLKQRFAERDGMFFTQEQVAEYDELYEKREGEQYLLVFDSIYSESDAVLWLRERLQKNPQSYQDIMPDFRKANRVNRKGELVAELKTVLEENFIQESDGKWRVPNMNEAKDRETLRNKSLLKEFDKYKEELENPKTKKIKEVRVEALRAGFKMCWEKKDFKTIVNLGDKIPQNILLEDEQLLMYYDIAKDRI